MAKRPPIRNTPYLALDNAIEGEKSVVLFGEKKYPVPVFGEHNFQNMSGALNICGELGMNADEFLTSMSTFKGAARRMETLLENAGSSIFYDFAHAPSKVKAAVHAVKQRFQTQKLRAILELHTFSSLNANFLPQYKDSLKLADEPYVYFNPQVLEHKRLAPITTEQVAAAFKIPEKNVLIESNKVKELIKDLEIDSNLLIMTSGNFGGLNLKEITSEM